MATDDARIGIRSHAAVRGGLSPTRTLSICAVLGPVVFTGSWIVLGLLRPGYSFVEDFISELGAGANGWPMNAAMILYGLLTIIGVVAVFQGLKRELGSTSRWACTTLLALSPLGLFLAGVFPADASFDAHMVGVQLAFGTPIVSFLAAGLVLRRVPSRRRFSTWLLFGAPLTLMLLIGFNRSVSEWAMGTGGEAVGLWQRVLITEVLVWFAALGASALRGSR